MDRVEKPKQQSAYANEGEFTTPAELPSATGREEQNFGPADIEQPVGARPRSEVTGRHDAGSGANETVDGLSAIEEAIRRGAEDIPTGAVDPDIDDVPVFDRADTLPKI